MRRSGLVKVLVTGFGPFPGVRDNPSGRLMDWIGERRMRLPRHIELKTACVPTCWAEAETFVSDVLPAYDPDVALHFGVHSRARSLRIEKVARNRAGGQPDAAGMCASGAHLMAGAPTALRATIDADKLVSALRARGIAAEASINAGRYLCNALLFHSLFQAGEGSPRLTGFVHIPPLGVAGMDRNALLRAAKIIVGHCAAEVNHVRIRHTASGG